MDDPSDVSGIFTTHEEESTFVSQSQLRRGGGGDNASDIVSGYPALDDESLIVSEDGGHSAVGSGIFTEQQSRATSGKDSAAGKSNGGRKSPAAAGLGGTNSYDVENSTTTGGNTNEIIGGYGTLSGLNASSPDEKKSNSWLSDAFQLFGLPLGTMPTAKSTPDKATTDLSPRQQDEALQSDLGDSVSALTPDKPVKTAAAAMAAYSGRATSGTSNPASGSSAPEPTKVCGVTTSRLILISGILVVVALIVVVVAVVVSNNDSDSSPPGIPDPDFIDFLTPAPTPSPSMDEVVVNPDCIPDDDETSFTVSQETVDCIWLRSREDVFIDVLCDTRRDIATTCRTTCQNCATEQPSFAPSQRGPSASPTTPSPTIFLITQFPTQPTLAPTRSPSASPTLAPVSSPTASPVSSPTASPVSSPTASPVSSPTASPVSSPTAAPVAGSSQPSAPTTISPTFIAPTSLPTSNPTFTRRPTPSPSTSPTFAPTVTANCEPDQEGTIPDSPPFWTCAWLTTTNVIFRRAQCADGLPAATHCPTTCRVCVED